MMSPSTTSALARATMASDTIHAGSAGVSAAATRKTSAPMILERDSVGSNLSRLDTREQALRSEHQHHGHDHIDHKQLKLRHEMHGRGAHFADNQRAKESAGDRTHAADRHHREGEHNHLDADAERHRNFRRHYRTAKRPQHGAKDESDGVDERHIDAEGGGNFAIEDHHREQPAPAGAVEHEADSTRKQYGERHEANVVAREHKLPDRGTAGDGERLVKRIGIGAPDELDRILEDQESRIGDEHNHDLVFAVNAAKEP